jgi:hypothetical protein
MGRRFNVAIDVLSDAYLKQDKRTRTEVVMDSFMESSFYDKMSRYADDAKQQKGAIDKGIKAFVNYFKDDSPLGKWERQVSDQWKQMMPQQQAVYSRPPADIEKHPAYKQAEEEHEPSASDTMVGTREDIYKAAVRKHIMKKMKDNQPLDKADVAALDGFDRFRAKQWNSTIGKQQGSTQGGPGTTRWDQQKQHEWDTMSDENKDTFDNNYDVYYKIEADKYTSRKDAQ